MKCYKCGAELMEGAEFCVVCGKKLPKRKKCAKCGEEMLEDAMFCTNCGNEFVPEVIYDEDSSKWKWIIAILFLLIACGVGAYYLYPKFFGDRNEQETAVLNSVSDEMPMEQESESNENKDVDLSPGTRLIDICEIDGIEWFLNTQSGGNYFCNNLAFKYNGKTYYTNASYTYARGEETLENISEEYASALYGTTIDTPTKEWFTTGAKIVKENPFGEYNETDNENDPYSWLSERKATYDDLEELNAKDLRILRNAIYAHHGYIFESEDLREYFGHFDWYHPNSSDVYDQLNSIEKANIEFIKRYE